MEIRVELANARLTGRRSGAELHVEQLEVDDETAFEELAQALLSTVLEQHGDAERVTIEVDERDERAESLYARLGFLPLRRVLGVEINVLRDDLERTPRGESFGSVHVQTDDLPAVERAVGASSRSRRAAPRVRWSCRLAAAGSPSTTSSPIASRPRCTGWDASSPTASARSSSPSASRRARSSATGLLDRGRLLDEYLSVPEYYGPLPSGEVVALAANPTLVERMTGGDRRHVRAAAAYGVRPDDLPAPAETAAALAAAMRIDGGDHGYREAVELPGAILIEL